MQNPHLGQDPHQAQTPRPQALIHPRNPQAMRPNQIRATVKQMSPRMVTIVANDEETTVTAGINGIDGTRAC